MPTALLEALERLAASRGYRPASEIMAAVQRPERMVKDWRPWWI